MPGKICLTTAYGDMSGSLVLETLPLSCQHRDGRAGGVVCSGVGVRLGEWCGGCELLAGKRIAVTTERVDWL